MTGSASTPSVLAYGVLLWFSSCMVPWVSAMGLHRVQATGPVFWSALLAVEAALVLAFAWAAGLRSSLAGRGARAAALLVGGWWATLWLIDLWEASRPCPPPAMCEDYFTFLAPLVAVLHLLSVGLIGGPAWLIARARANPRG